MASGTAGVRCTFTSRGVAALRIEMRLLSETRKVFEYLPKLSVSIQKCDCDTEAIFSQFSENSRSSEAETQKQDGKQ
jgi:hypothetical protein